MLHLEGEGVQQNKEGEEALLKELRRSTHTKITEEVVDKKLIVDEMPWIIKALISENR